ncbi:hypothetical protein PCAR4_10104 [Paraburkholderia caribensis]|nr:hypothetical protein PCAR4_10104 [Paraburkholderia caribensis]
MYASDEHADRERGDTQRGEPNMQAGRTAHATPVPAAHYVLKEMPQAYLLDDKSDALDDCGPGRFLRTHPPGPTAQTVFF